MSNSANSEFNTSWSEQVFLNWLTWIGFVAAMISVGLQMGGVNGGFFTNYLADLAGPVWMYGILRQKKTVLKNVFSKIATPARAAILVFLVGTAWEACQTFDFSGTPLSITRGRFDPLDIVCYAVSLAACYIADQVYAMRLNRYTSN
jgi:hypothetical protein